MKNIMKLFLYLWIKIIYMHSILFRQVVVLKIYPHTPRGKGVYFSKKMINIFYKIIPPYPLSSILLTSYTSHIPTHHPSYLNNFLQ